MSFAELKSSKTQLEREYVYVAWLECIGDTKLMSLHSPAFARSAKHFFTLSTSFNLFLAFRVCVSRVYC